MSDSPVEFPNESPEYRKARAELLSAEGELRAAVEAVAAKRRTLPLGGAPETDYLFDRLGAGGEVEQVKLSELFAPGKDSLFVYSLMYGPSAKRPCPLCTSFLDSLDGSAGHVAQRVNLAVVARSPIERIAEFSASRNWGNLPLLSSTNNTYNTDYLAEDAQGAQWPMANVFVKRDGEVRHFWGSELFYAPSKNMDRRHVDMLWPLWNLFDLTPEGRGADWYPALDYGNGG